MTGLVILLFCFMRVYFRYYIRKGYRIFALMIDSGGLKPVEHPSGIAGIIRSSFRAAARADKLRLYFRPAGLPFF